MALTVLEIVVVGAEGLKSAHLFQDLLPYPVAIIRDDSGIDHYDSENKKTVDVNGGSNPVWRVLFEFDMDTVEARQKQFQLIVRVESHRKTPCTRDKFIGEVCVPIEELLNDSGDADEKKSATRPLLNKGKDHGSLTFTYKFRRIPSRPAAALPQPQPAAALPQPQPQPAVIPQPQPQPAAGLPQPQPQPAVLPQPQPQPQPAALPQPANGNSVEIPPVCNNESHSLAKAVVGGVVSGFVSSVGSVVKEVIFR